MTWSNDFETEIRRQWAGRKPKARIFVRLRDGDPGTLYELTNEETALRLSPIIRRREFEFGRVEGQSTTMELSHFTRTQLRNELEDCYACIRVGYEEADIWETMAQGKISKAEADTNLRLILTVQDAVMELLDKKLAREYMFDTSAWVGEVRVDSKADTSSSFDNAANPPTILNAAACEDELFEIEFDSATTFKYRSDRVGTWSGSRSIASNQSLYGISLSGNPSIQLPTAGWDQTGGAYLTGDRFFVCTSKARTTAELNPIAIVRYLITAYEAARIRVYDVMNGYLYQPDLDSGLYNEPSWDALELQVNYMQLTGYWDRDSQISELIQDALKVCHGSIYPTPTGQIGLWMLTPALGVGAILNGDPEAGDRQVLWARETRDRSQLASKATLEYLDRSGEDAIYTAEDTSTDYNTIVEKTIRCGWRLGGTEAHFCADKYIERFKTVESGFDIRAILAGAVEDLSSGVVLTEPKLGVVAERSDPVEISLDFNADACEVRIETTKQTSIYEDYAVVGSAVVGTSEVW